MAQKDLIPFSEMSEEERKRISSNGGKKSGQVRRARKAMRESMELLLALPVKSETTKHALKKFGVDKEDLNNQMALMAVIFKQAMTGDLDAVSKVQEIVGELAPKKQQSEVNITSTNVNPFEGLTVDELKAIAGVGGANGPDKD